MPDTELINRLAASRPGVATDTVSAANGQALRHLARRHQYLTSEIDALDIDLAVLVEQAAPSLVASRGIGTMTAAQMLITAGDNPDRLRSEAAFAALCGTSPIPASSGRTNRYRLNRGGDRQANKALHQIALARLANDLRTRAYAAKKRAEGKTTKDVLRCLKRAIAREIYRHLSRPCPVPDNGDLRPLRQAKGHTLTEVARHFGAWPARISDIERGKRRDDDFAHTYREWLLAS